METRYRLGFKFWLNTNNSEEEKLAEQIKSLKRKRSFSKTVRDGIRLICSLRDGRLDVLQQLFPWVWDQITLEVQANQPKSEESPSRHVIHTQLQRLEEILRHVDKLGCWFTVVYLHHDHFSLSWKKIPISVTPAGDPVFPVSSGFAGKRE